MSLINKMLRDLEARQHAVSERAVSQPVYEDLRPAEPDRIRRRALPWILVLATATVIAASLVARHHQLAPTRVSTTAAMPVRPGPTVAVTAHPAVKSRTDKRAETAIGAAEPGAIDLRRRSAAARVRLAQTGRQPQTIHESPAHRTVKTIRRVVAVQPSHSGQSVSGGNAVGTHGFEKTEIPLTTGQIAENAYRRGVNLLAQGHPALARLALRSALRRDPRNLPARELLAGLLLQQGRQSDAARVLEQGLAVLPQQTAFVYLLARIDAARDAPGPAIALLERGLASAGSDPDYLALLATLDQREGNNAAAVQLFGQALALRPLDGNWWIGLGISLESESRWASARQAYSRATLTRLNPTLKRYAEERLDALRWR